MDQTLEMPALSGAAAVPIEQQGSVWVVDDDDMRVSLSFTLKPRFETASFPSVQTFLARADLDHPGCLVVAERMANAGARGVQAELAALKSPISVIFLAQQSDIRTAVRAMENGAVSFLEKPVDPDELTEAVEKGLRRSVRLARRNLLMRLFETLSRREKQIFILVCQGLRNGDIAPLLNLSQRTVEVHRAHLGRKLGNAAPIRLLYELTQTSDGNLLSAQFDELDQSALERAINASAATSS